jgi:hypothetical protein
VCCADRRQGHDHEDEDSMQRSGTLTIARTAVAGTAALLAVTGLVATATAGAATGRTTSAKASCTRTVVAAGDMEGIT